MADLQSCYFCGEPDDVGEYAVVPPRLGGGDRSVVLCPDCKTKLLRAMEPLIERAEATAEPSTSEAGRGDSGSAQVATTSTVSNASSPDGESPEFTASPTDEQPREDTPPQYRRAMRMLSNRAFPIDRHEVESMLANAYELEREEIEAVLDHAQAEGRLIEENGQLREP
ncbi:MAG: hypothetical protein ACOCQU_03150 [Halolamina sp.]